MNIENKLMVMWLLGVIIGILLVLAIMSSFDKLPFQIRKQYEIKAVSLGYGQYVVDTNTVTVKFEWIEKK